MQTIVSEKELKQFAESFWNYVNGRTLFAFHGEMGAGKTTLINALCHAKGVKDVTGSPTFSIINQYTYSENGKEQSIYHIDLYRLKDEQEIVQAGVEDCVYSGSICMVEWPDKAPYLFEEEAVHVYIEHIDNNHRTVKIALPANHMAEHP